MENRAMGHVANGVVAVKSKEKVNLWTERIIVCRKCSWQGAETPKCPRCGIPLSNYSLAIIPV